MALPDTRFPLVDSRGLISRKWRTALASEISAAGSGTYQPLDAQLTALAGLTYGSNALKVIRVNAGGTGFELATISTAASWGSITGTLSSQTDLQSALDAKLSTASAASTYQPLDAQLTDFSGLSYTGNALKVVRVNAGENGLELATVSGGSGLDHQQVMARNVFGGPF